MVKKSVDANYSALSEKTELSHKDSKFKVDDRVSITKYKNIFIKGYTENWSKEVFVTDSVLKTSLWTYKMKNLNREKISGSLYEHELLLSKL